MKRKSGNSDAPRSGQASGRRETCSGARYPVRMQDVADAAGVSRMTVSRALRHDGSVSVETRARVQAVIDRLGYVPDQMAAGFSSGRSGFVALLIPSIEHSIFAQTLKGITRILNERGLQALIGDTDYRLEQEERLIETLLKRRPEGIIVTGGGHTPRGRRLLAQAGIPVVEMWDLPEQPIQHAVGFSHRKAGYLMARHLCDKGYRHIGFIGGDDGGDTRGAERRQGFLDAMAETELPPPSVVTFANPPITVEQGGQALLQLLHQRAELDAVFCVSDMAAVGAIMQCHRRGLRIPQDIAIAGFGDFEIARACFPGITTIGCDWQALGEAAARRLLAAIDASSTSQSAAESAASDRAMQTTNACTTLIDFRVIEREST